VNERKRMKDWEKVRNRDELRLRDFLFCESESLAS
jgi:hypothetical protein